MTPFSLRLPYIPLETSIHPVTTTGITCRYRDGFKIGDWMSRYDHLLLIYFSVAHDPMQLNRQGSDRGTQYRSAIVPQSYQQAKIAKAYISQLNQARAYNAAVVTKIEPDKAFYPSEAFTRTFSRITRPIRISS